MLTGANQPPLSLACPLHLGRREDLHSWDPHGPQFRTHSWLPLTGTVRIARRLVLCLCCLVLLQPCWRRARRHRTYSTGTHGSPTVRDPASCCDRPCGEDARPVGRPSKVRNPISVSHLSSYHSASNSSSAPATLGTTGPSSPRSCTSKPTPTSAPGWTPMTLVGEIFLLFARVRLHPFLEKWILLPHDDMPHTHGASSGWWYST